MKKGLNQNNREKNPILGEKSPRKCHDNHNFDIPSSLGDPKYLKWNYPLSDPGLVSDFFCVNSF